jgi:hypothetical protein
MKNGHHDVGEGYPLAFRSLAGIAEFVGESVPALLSGWLLPRSAVG